MEGIPKIIHYCWFGEGKIPNQYQKYIKTWEKTFPEYRICKWDEKNFPMEKYKYAMEALKSGKMAFVSDVARMAFTFFIFPCFGETAVRGDIGCN